MYPISPVIEGYQEHEIIFARNQPEYLPLPALRLVGPQTPVVSRWTFTEEERVQIAAGKDILMTQYIFTDKYHPIHMEVAE